MTRRSEPFVVAGFGAVAAYIGVEIGTRFVRERMVGGGGRNNAALFPGLLAGALAIVVTAYLVTTLRTRTRTGTHGEPARVDARRRVVQVSVFGVFVAYLALIDVIGYFVTTPLAMIAMFRILGVRAIVLNVAVSVVAMVVVWLLFSELMRIPLPTGRFGWYV